MSELQEPDFYLLTSINFSAGRSKVGSVLDDISEYKIDLEDAAGDT